MAMVVLTSEPNTKTSKAISFPSSNYLTCVDDESFDLKIADEPSRSIDPFILGTQKHIHLQTNNAENPFISGTRKHTHLQPNKAESPFISGTRNHIGNKAEEDGEIDVFAAEKYFNEAVEEECHQKKDEGDHHHHAVEVLDPVKPRSRPRTPSTRSESSWNSRTVLLQKVPRTHHLHPTTNSSIKFRGKKFLASIGCNCSCKDKNSLDIEAEKREKPPIRIRDNNNMQMMKNYPEEEAEDMNRKSIEVYGSPVPGIRKSFNLERRLTTMVTWDAIAPRSENENPIDYDTGSEASSDLFEIESFPRLPCVTPTTSYAPSEASIEWSVVTASAADFSVASDSEEPKTLPMPRFHRELNTKEKPKRLPSILLGCKSQKAVDVYRSTSERANPGGARRHHTTSSEANFMPLTRFHTESKISSFGARKGGGSFSTSISNRETHVLYI